MNGATFAFAALAVVTALWLWIAAALRVVYSARRPREGPPRASCATSRRRS